MINFQAFQRVSRTRFAMVLLTLVLANMSKAQTQPPVRPPIPESVFPLGGLQFGLDQEPADWNKYLPQFGLNTVMNAPTDPANKFSVFTPGISGYPEFDFGFPNYARSMRSAEFELAS